GTSAQGTITQRHGDLTRSGSHTYVGDTSNPHSEGTATITTTIRHENTQPQTAISTATITEPNIVAGSGFAYTVTEGSATVTNVALATFTDPGNPTGTAEDADDYAATIDWGDGTSSAGTISQSGGVFTVSGSHTYVGDTVNGESEGVAHVIVTMTHESLPSITAISTATITEPNIVAGSGFAYTVTEGSATVTNVALATFTDPGNPTGTAEDADDYAATIDWGDGTSSAGTISQSGGVFTVSGSHTYVGDTVNGESEGVAHVIVTMTHESLPSITVGSTVTITDPNIVAGSGFAYTVTEGSATVTNVALATFTDPGNPTGTAEDADDYAATIDWGDGTSSAGTISQSGGVFTVSGSHTYVGDTVNGESEGVAHVIVTMTHESLPSITVGSTVTITDPNIVAGSGFAYTVTEGSATVTNVALATFTDPGNPTGTAEDADDYAATIDWGDGTSSAGTISQSGGVFTVSGSHTYVGDTVNGESEGVAHVIVTMTHESLPSITVGSTVTITDPNIVAGSGFAYTVTEGSATVTNVALATFTDPGNPTGTAEDADDYAATIDWGDGTSSAGTISQSGGVFTVSGSHTYVGDTVNGESEGVAHVIVTMTHESLPSITVGSTVTITDPNIVAGSGFAYTVTEGSATVTNVALATFTDPGNPTGTAEDADDYAATIDWGDGTSSAGTISQSGGVFTVSGSHTYVGDTVNGESEGVAHVIVTMTHESLPSITVGSTVTITDPNIVAGSGFAYTVTEGSATVTNVALATFTDPGNPTGTAEDADDYAATIDWGDGTSSAGTISQSGGVFTVSGSHTYVGDTVNGESEGVAHVIVTMTHESLPSITVGSTVTITDPNIVAGSGFAYTVTE